MFEIINTITETDIKNDYVAIGSYVDDNRIPEHSILIIKYKNETYQFHYTGPRYGILFDSEVGINCFHKITHTIDERLIPSFIVMCKKIMIKATPTYGYFYSGEYYDINGDHFSDKKIGEVMTCAGFCLSILKGFLEKDYVAYEDWDSSSHKMENYLDFYASKHGYNKEDIAESHRRISPLDLLCSGFFSNLPIRKFQIDSKSDETMDYLINF